MERGSDAFNFAIWAATSAWGEGEAWMVNTGPGPPSRKASEEPRAKCKGQGRIEINIDTPFLGQPMFTVGRNPWRSERNESRVSQSLPRFANLNLAMLESGEGVEEIIASRFACIRHIQKHCRLENSAKAFCQVGHLRRVADHLVAQEELSIESSVARAHSYRVEARRQGSGGIIPVRGVGQTWIASPSAEPSAQRVPRAAFPDRSIPALSRRPTPQL